MFGLIIGPDKQIEHKIVIIFLFISLTCVLGAQKNRLIETVLLSTHNIYFGQEIRKLNFHFAFWIMHSYLETGWSQITLFIYYSP